MSNAALDFSGELLRRQHAANALADFLRAHGDPGDLIRQMIAQNPDAVERAIKSCNTARTSGELVVRNLNEYAPGAAADAGARGQTFAAGGSSQPAAGVPHRKEMP